MSALSVIAAAVLLVPMGAPAPQIPGACLSMVFRNYAPSWCGEKDNAAYEQFVRAFAEYKASIDKVYEANLSAVADLTSLCTPSSPPSQNQVAGALVDLDLVSRPQMDAANTAWNTMLSSMSAAFQGNPDQASIAANVRAQKAVMEALGKNTMDIETNSALAVTSCVSAEAAEPYAQGLRAETFGAISAYTDYEIASDAIDASLAKTSTTCAQVRVVPPISGSEMEKKTGSGTKTTSTGGASLTMPKKVEVRPGKTKVPITVTTPPTGYGKITVKRGPKGLVATGGQMTGSFGAWLTLPDSTKPGKVVVTVTAGSVSLKGTVRLR